MTAPKNLALDAACEVGRLARFLVNANIDTDDYRAVHKACMVRLDDLSDLLCVIAEGNDPERDLRALRGLAR